MSKQPPDDRDVELKKALRMRFLRLNRRGSSAWANLGRFLDDRKQPYSDDIFKFDQMTIAQLVAEATDENGVGLPLMTLVDANIKFDGVDIVEPCTHVFAARHDYDEERIATLTVDTKVLEKRRAELRSLLEAEFEKAREAEQKKHAERLSELKRQIEETKESTKLRADLKARLEQIEKSAQQSKLQRSKPSSLAKSEVDKAEHRTRRRITSLLDAKLIEEVNLTDGEKIAYRSTTFLREALDSMISGVWE